MEETAAAGRPQRIACPLEGPRREELRAWLGRRFGRYPFPNEIQRSVIDRIGNVLARLAKDANYARVIDSAVWFGVRYTEENPNYGFLVLLDPALLVSNKVPDGFIQTIENKLFGLLAASSKETGYSPEIEVRTADAYPSSKLLAYSPFSPGE